MTIINALEIGKEISNAVKTRKRDKFFTIVEEVAIKYNISWPVAFYAYDEYKKRQSIFKEEALKKTRTIASTEHKHYYNDKIINLLLNAITDEDLYNILNNFNWDVIRDSIIEYLNSNYNLESNKDILEAKLEQMNNLKSKKQYTNNKNIDENKNKVKKVIDIYLNSNDVVPDNIVLNVFTSIYSLRTELKTFYKYLDLFKNGTLEEQEYYNRYNLEKNKRINVFLVSTKLLLDDYNNKSLRAVDIELLTGLSLKKFKSVITKNDIYTKLNVNRSYVLAFLNYIDTHFNTHEISKEEAFSFKYSYNEINISNYLESIIDFLNYKHISLTKTNLIDTFEKYIDGTLDININNSKMKDNNIKKVKEIICTYIISNDVYPDKILGNYYNNIRLFDQTLKSFANTSEENKRIYSYYIQIKNKRVNEFLDKVNEVYIRYPIIKNINIVEIELITGMNIKDFIIYLIKADAENKFGMSWTRKLKSIIRNNMTNKILSLEEALKIKETYHNKVMNVDDIIEIKELFDNKNILFTYTNIISAFKLKVDGKLYDKEKTKSVE